MERAWDLNKNQTLEQKQKHQQEQQRETFLLQLLTPEARERLTKLKTLQPESAQDIESILIRAFRSGMLKDRVTESDLLSLLERNRQAREQQKMELKRFEYEDNK